MIISEQQIMQLINIARQSLDFMDKDDCPSYRLEILCLLKRIESQQSEELKVIE